MTSTFLHQLTEQVCKFHSNLSTMLQRKNSCMPKKHLCARVRVRKYNREYMYKTLWLW